MEQTLNSDQNENESHVIIDDILPGIKVAQCNIAVQMVKGDYNLSLSIVFLRKVFGILSLQFIFTILITTCIVVLLKDKDSPMLALASISFLVSVVAMHSLKHKTPASYIVLAAFTACKAFLAGAIVSRLNSFHQVGAFGFLVLAFVDTLLLTVYTLQKKKKYTTWNASNTVALCLLSVLCFLLLLGGTPDMSLIFIGSVIVFPLFIIYDFDLIMNRLSPDEYILAIITLYLDAFMLIPIFLEFLKRQYYIHERQKCDVRIAKTPELSKVEKN